MAFESGQVTVADFQQLLKEQHPFAALIGIEIVALEDGTAQLRLPADPSHTRLGGVVAGPMLMALSDMALYAAVVSATGKPEAVTASLSINFVRGVPPGGIVARADVVKTGRLTVGEVRLYPESAAEHNGATMVAHAISTWSLPRSK